MNNNRQDSQRVHRVAAAIRRAGFVLVADRGGLTAAQETERGTDPNDPEIAAQGESSATPPPNTGGGAFPRETGERDWPLAAVVVSVAIIGLVIRVAPNRIGASP